MKKIVTSLVRMLLVLLVVEPGLTHAQTSPMVLGSTNRGELVEIDLIAGTVQLLGTAPSPGRWSDLAMDPAGNLYAVSTWAIEPSSVCFGQFGFGPCAHLYRLDPTTGAVLQHIGDLEAAFVSDIDFTESFILYGSRFVDTQPQEDGGLVTIHPVTASITVPPNIRFGSLENGGLAVHPLTGDLWGIENQAAVGPGTPSIFKVDPSTGLAILPVVPLGFGGQPVTFGFDALEILPDGRFIATITGSSGLNEIYEINPVPSPSGLAEVTLIPLNYDPAITGHVNGLTVVPEAPVDTPEINFHGQLDIVFEDNGSGVYSGVPVGTEFFGAIDDIFSGFISDGTTRTPFTCCLETDDSVFIDNDDVLDADDATLINSLAGTNFVAGDVLDFITIGGSALTAGGTRIFISLTYVLDSLAFDDDSLGNYPPDPDDILITVFVIEELRSGLTISFDTFDNLGSDAVAIDVLVNGELVGRNLTNPFTDGSFVPVSVVFDADGTLDMTFDGNSIFEDLPTGFTPVGSDRFGFGGRTGAGNEVHRIDNVSISVCTDTFGCPPPDAAPPDAEYVNDFSASVGPANLFGTAVLDSGSVRLTNSINFQLGSLVINDLVPGEAITSFAATFDLQMGPGSFPPADGISFNLGVMPDVAFGEDGPDDEATIYEALGVVEIGEPVPSPQLLLRRSTDSRWFAYVINFDDTTITIEEKGSLSLTRNTAFQTVSRSDFNGDGRPDILLRDVTGAENGRWVMALLSGNSILSEGFVALTRNADWEFIATRDFDGDGKADLLLRNSVDGRWLMYLLDGQSVKGSGIVAMSTDAGDVYVDSADFNGDRRADILLRRADGSWLLYTIDGLNPPAAGVPAMTTNLAFAVLALDDFNADNRADVLLRRTDGRWFLYLMDGAIIADSGALAMSENTDFDLMSCADFNGDGSADALLRRGDGRWFLYTLNGLMIVSQGSLPLTRNTAFRIVSVEDFSGDNMADLLMRRTDGRWVLYAIDGNGPSVLKQGIPDMTRNEDWVPQLE